MYYINTLKRELVDTNAYKLQPSVSERVIVDGHGCHTALHFGVKAKENQDKVPTLYWLPKLHKKLYKARFIANSSSCTTTELSKLLTSCLTAVKKHVIKYCEKVYERSGKNLFWSIKNSGEILDKLKARDFNATRGAQWLSGRVLDSRPKGRGFEPHRRHCVVVLEQDTFILA